MNNYQKQPGSNSVNRLNVLDIIRILLGRFYWIILAGIVTAGLVYGVLKFLVTPTYESSVSFYVYNSSDTSARTGTVNNNDLQAAESLATTYSKILGSNSVLDAVLAELDDQKVSNRKDLRKMIKASVIDDTQLLEVTVKTTDPEFSCDVAEAFAEVAPTEIVRITKAGGAEVVDRPEVATEKASPKTAFDTIIGFLIGAVAASAAIVVITLSDRTIYLPEDIEKIGEITILGQIPEIRIKDEVAVPWKISEGGVLVSESEK